MVQNLRTRSRTALMLTVALAAVSLIGCNERTVVDATPRNSPYQPVFGDDDSESETPAEASPPANGLDISFFHEDHFACLEVAIAKGIKNPQLSGIPWERMHEQLVPWVGEENADLKKMERAWLLVDRENLNLANLVAPQNAASPVVFVLEYAEPFDADSLNSAIVSQAESDRNQVSERGESEQPAENNGEEISVAADFVVQPLNPKRIAMGGQKLIQKLALGTGQTTSLAGKFGQLDIQADVNGVLMVGPIRSLIQSVFGMAGGFSEEAKKISQMPEFIQYVEMQLSIDDENLFVAKVYLDDENTTKELGKMINEGTGASQSNPLASGMPAATPELMIPVESTEVLKEVGKEIRDRGLLTVLAKDKVVSIKLKRPEKTEALISALINDGRNQTRLVVRTENFARIADALKEYESTHGELPAAAVALGDSEDQSHPFSWRVALLPLLGEQELYDQFDFSQPWDSKDNLAVAEQIPDVYKIVSSDQSSNKTRIQLPAGDDCLYRNDNQAPKLDEISDRRNWTTIVIEAGTKSETIWTQPGAIQVDSMTDADFGKSNENGVLIVTAAFKTRIVKKGRQLQDTLTISGDETMSISDFLDASIMRR